MNKSKVANSIFLVIIFSLFFSNIIAIGYSNEVGITDGMYVKYIFDSSSRRSENLDPLPGTATYTKTSDEIIHVDWKWSPCESNCIGSYDVSTSTRIVSNFDGSSPSAWNGGHDLAWIFTDVSLNDQITIFNRMNSSDTVFTITGEANYGSMAVWQLEDDHESVVWYEKSKGFLVNGTFRYKTYWAKFEFEATNALGSAAVPGYNYIFLIGLLLVSAIVLLKHKSIRK